MTPLKTFFATVFGILGAVILAPFVAFFGLIMLGLTFGLSLIAVGVVAAAVKQAKDASSETLQTTAPRTAI